MAENAQSLAIAAMTLEEREAVGFAENYYGAEAKLQASKLLEGLGVDVEAAEVVLGGLSAQLDGLDFTLKHETADHFRRLGEILGNVAMTPAAYLVPVPEPEQAPLEPGAQLDQVIEEHQPSDLDEQIAPDDVVTNPKEDKSQDVNNSLSLNATQKRFLTSIFDEHNQSLISQFSTDQLRALLDQLGDHYESLSIMRLNASAKAARRIQMQAFMLGTETFATLAEQFEITPAAVIQGFRKMGSSITKRTEKHLLDKMVASASKQEVVEPVQTPIDEEDILLANASIEPEPTIDDLQQEQEEVRLSESRSLKSASKELGAFLCLEKEERLYLNDLFDAERRRKETAPEALAVRDTVQSLYGIVKNNRTHNFTELETVAFDLFLGPNPMTVRELRERLSAKLKENHMRVEDILSSCIVKILEERERVVRGGHGVLAN